MSKNIVHILPSDESYRQTVIGFIFSKPVSFDLSIAIENACCFIAVTSIDLKNGANEPFIMQVVFVLAQAYFLAISLSGKTFFKSGLK